MRRRKLESQSTLSRVLGTKTVSRQSHNEISKSATDSHGEYGSKELCLCRSEENIDLIVREKSHHEDWDYWGDHARGQISLEVDQGCSQHLGGKTIYSYPLATRVRDGGVQLHRSRATNVKFNRTHQVEKRKVRRIRYPAWKILALAMCMSIHVDARLSGFRSLTDTEPHSAFFSNLNTTHSPTESPTSSPTTRPTPFQTNEPTYIPSLHPSDNPTRLPSQNPSFTPTSLPSLTPSHLPSKGPSNYPSVSISPTQVPSLKPSESVSPTRIPSKVPSSMPTNFPSIQPTLSIKPSSIPSTSQMPSKSPSKMPSKIPSLDPSSVPTNTPSSVPTTSIAPSLSPSHVPTDLPSLSLVPSMKPSSTPSLHPSTLPTFIPSSSPSLQPSISQSPSSSPSMQPSLQPTVSSQPSSKPSKSPTAEPTNYEISEAFANYMTIVTSPRKMNETEVVIFCDILSNYTNNFLRGTSHLDRVTTTCTVSEQTIEKRRLKGRKGVNIQNIDHPKRVLLNKVNLVRYVMRFDSLYTDVTNYTSDFKAFMSDNTSLVQSDLREAGTGVDTVSSTIILENTDSPTSGPSGIPSKSPSYHPSTQPSIYPSLLPSALPSLKPSVLPSISPSMDPSDSPSSRPTRIPSSLPSSIPSNVPTSKPRNNTNTVITAASLSSAGAVFLLIVGMCWRRRRPQPSRTNTFRPLNPRTGIATTEREDVMAGNLSFPIPHDGTIGTDYAVTGVPRDLMRSSEASLIDVDSSIDGNSVVENDSTYILADEFDLYKDQNLEEMRAKVQGNLSNFDGMMSQAMTKALMDDMDDNEDSDMENFLHYVSQSPMEIEANVLCETNDWLKQKSGASTEEKREFMQETLNKMVANVRHNIIEPDDASRTIHECAAMLGLQLATDIPETALIVTGMRKRVTRTDVIHAFREFGEIQDAAVASNYRGFGLVRYRSRKSLSRAKERFEKGEIEVQDVAATLIFLQR